MTRSIYRRGIRDLRRAINEPMQRWPINAIGGARSELSITRPAAYYYLTSASPYDIGSTLSVADQEDVGGNYTIAITLTEGGTLTLSGTTGLTGSGSGTASLSYTGTTTAINNALNGADIAGLSDETGVMTVTFSKEAVSVQANISVTAYPALAITTLAPSDDSTDTAVDRATYTATFNRDIQLGTGNIVLKVAGGSAVETFNAATGAGDQTGLVAVSGAQLIISPGVTLDGETEHAIQIAATAVDGADIGTGDSFAGIANDTTWSFTTEDVDAPTISTLDPADNSIDHPTTDSLIATFSENIFFGTGSIRLVETGVGTVETFSVVTETGDNGGTVSISTTALTINPGSDLTDATAYHVEIDATAIEDGAGNSFAGISDATTWNFTATEDILTDGAGTPVDLTTTLKTRQAWQRGVATIVLSGTYSVVGGNPNGMVWRVGSGDWIQLTSETIGGGNWSGTLSIPSDYLAQGTLQIRPKNGSAVTPYEFANVTVSDVFAYCGDSMAAGAADAADTYTKTNFDWVHYSDGTYSSITSQASSWPQLMEQLDQAGIPPVLVKGEAASGSAFHPGTGGSWDPTPVSPETSFYYDNAVTDLNAANTGGWKLLIWEHGPNDVIDGSTTYDQDLKDLIDAFQADVDEFAGVKMLISIIGEVNGETTNLDTVRAAQLSAIATDADILRGPSWIDLDYGDDVHVGNAPAGTEQQVLVGNRWWRAIEYHCYNGSDAPDGPTISSATLTDTDEITVTFDRAVTNHTDTTGWKVEDNSGVASISSAAQGGTTAQVVLTTSRDLTTNLGEVEEVSVTFGQDNDAVGATLADTATISYPPEYEIDYDAGEAYPHNTVQPALDGSPTVGVEVTCDGGTWESTSALSYAYQWLEEAGGASISGATSASYTPVAGDSGYLSTMVCRVTATNSKGSVAVNSNTGSFDPASVFSGGKEGGWWRIDQIGSLFQDSAGSTAVTADADPVGRITDSSGNANHMLQATGTSRPAYDTDDTYDNINGDGSADNLQTATTAMDGDVLMIVAADFTAATGTLLSYTNANDLPGETIDIEHNRVRAPTNDFGSLGTTTISPTGDAVVCVVATESDGSIRTYVNGSLIGTISYTGSNWFAETNTNKVISLLRRGQAAFPDYNSGAVFGALVVVGANVADDRANLETYFGNLIGLSI